MNVINKNGTEINYEAAVALMDDEIREQLHNELAPCEDQEFFSAYEKAHEEKIGEEWELSKENPVW
ncbi:hypothetical protein [Anaerotruncus rubiinfantis]|uniref:hypothetical protein n=1 Tax=Anaerotruncus rubiinfantis TaxID=1720200 RepID=UPI0034A5AA18